jgi:hypothetical protein
MDTETLHVLSTVPSKSGKYRRAVGVLQGRQSGNVFLAQSHLTTISVNILGDARQSLGIRPRGFSLNPIVRWLDCSVSPIEDVRAVSEHDVDVT